jgi:ankyrin repeat protein
LNATYKQILSQITPENEILAARVLTWLIYAIEPLGLREIVEAIAIEDESSSLQSLDKILVPEDVFEICGPLIRQLDLTGSVELAHSSVFQYLVSTSRELQPPPMFQLEKTRSKIYLSLSLVTYLSFKDFKVPLIKRPTDLLENDITSDDLSLNFAQERPFYDYAIRNWWRHLPDTLEGIDDVWPQLSCFINDVNPNFKSFLVTLGYLAGLYKYPPSMNTIQFCASNGINLVLSRLLAENEEENVVKIDSVVEDGRSALHMACENDQFDVVELLLHHGASLELETLNGWTPIQYAVEIGSIKIVDRLLAAGASAHAQFISTLETPLSVAVTNGWYSLVQLLLSSATDPNIRTGTGLAPIHIAAIKGNVDILSLLLKSEANPFIGDNDSWTALHHATNHGNSVIVSRLLETSNHNMIFEPISWTPLHVAVEKENIEIMSMFISYAYRISRKLTELPANQSQGLATTTGSMSAGFLALSQNTEQPRSDSRSSEKQMGTAERTNEQHQSSSEETEKDFLIPTPLCLAISREFLAGIDLLLETGVTEIDEEVCIEKALSEHKFKALERILLKSNDLKRTLSFVDSKTKQHGLFWPSLLKNITQSSKWKPYDLLKFTKVIHDSSQYEILDYIIVRRRQLSENSGEPLEDLTGPLLQEVINLKNPSAVTHLITSGANFHQRIFLNLDKQHLSIEESSLLHFAVDMGDENLVNLLLQLGIKPWIVDSLNRTPLHCASQIVDIDLDIISLLLSYGAVLDAEDNLGHTPIQLAIKCGNEGVVQLLLSSEKRPNASLDAMGCTPDHLSIVMALNNNDSKAISNILYENPELIELLFPPNNQTMVHLAAQQECNHEVLDVISKYKPDLEVFDSNNKTAMQVAAPKARKYLIRRGALWRKD